MSYLKMFILLFWGIMLSTATEITSEPTADAAKNEQITKECNPETGYTYYPTGSCYKVYKRALTWVQANALCNVDDGYLAILNNEEEAQAISGILNNLDVDQAWVGHRDRNSNGYWSSSHGDPQDKIFNVWSQPRAHYLEFKSCAALKRDVTLTDQSCLDELYYACEKEF